MSMNIMETFDKQMQNAKSLRSTSPLDRKRKRSAIPNDLLPPPPFIPQDLSDLIRLARLSKKRLYKDCQLLYPMLEPLQDLQAMIGLKDLKQQVFDFIIMRLQKKTLQIPLMGHMLLFGGPGVGKSTFVRILARILSVLGCTCTNNVVFGKPSNLIGRYLGSTPIITEQLVKSAFGGVLVIDEASSLADGRDNGSSGDSFSKSCIDTINRMLTEYAGEFTCVLAGYEEDIRRDVLSINPGMDRRFTTIFRIDGYKPVELQEIAIAKLRNKNLFVEEKAMEESIFSKKIFPSYAGDVEVFCDKITIAHAKRVFGTDNKITITTQDVKLGLEMFKLLKKQKKEDDMSNLAMYS